MAELSLPTLAARANEAHQRAEGAAHSALEFARQAGEYLAQAKSMCKHGEWLPWLEKNFAGSRWTATNYMRLADQWDELDEAVSNGERVPQMSMRQALEWLAESTDEEPPTVQVGEEPGIQKPPRTFWGAGVV